MAYKLRKYRLPSNRGPREKHLASGCRTEPFSSTNFAIGISENMVLKGLLVTCFSLIPLVGGQGAPPSSMLNVLSTNPQLSALSILVHSLPLLVQQFKSADNFTFLAPTDNAISSWLATNRSVDDIQATLQYHLLNGTFPSVSIPSTPIFVPTALTNQSYCNVTGGQRLKAWNDGNIKFGSALQTTSNAISTVNITTSLQVLKTFV